MVLVSGTFSGTAHLGMMGHRILARASWPIVALMFGRTIGKFSNLGTESPGISAEQLSCWCCPREPRPCKAGSCPTRTWARGQPSCPLQGVYLEVGGVQGLGSRPPEISTVSLGCLEQAQSPHRSHSCPAAPRGREPSGDQSPQSPRAGTRFWQRERGLAVPEGRSSELTEKGPLWEGEVFSRAVETLRVAPAQSWRGHGSRRHHSLDLAAGVPAGQAPLAPPGPWLRSVVSCLLYKGHCPGPWRVLGGHPPAGHTFSSFPAQFLLLRTVPAWWMAERSSRKDPCFCMWRGCGL